MERVFGPLDGYYVAVYVRDTGESGNELRAFYKIFDHAPVGYSSSGSFRHKRVSGITHNAEQAFAIALQLARLQIAGLPGTARPSSARTVPVEAKSEALLAPFPAAGAGTFAYSPTIPAALSSR